MEQRSGISNDPALSLAEKALVLQKDVDILRLARRSL